MLLELHNLGKDMGLFSGFGEWLVGFFLLLLLQVVGRMN